ncbi:MAG: aminopeptidase [Clostridium sp.]|nr:aminopeptidase [Clostridium sp.]
MEERHRRSGETPGADTERLVPERLGLAWERISQMGEEHFGQPDFERYFASVARFLLQTREALEFVASGRIRTASLEELRAFNHALYEDVAVSYEASYANPAFAGKALGREYGALCAFLYFEMRSLIAFAHEQRVTNICIRLELFLEIYGVFCAEWRESRKLPAYEDVRRIIYSYVFDYCEIAGRRKVAELVGAVHTGLEILEASDPADIRYLFRYGEYVTENEIETARFLSGLPQETIDLMADTYTEGYRRGFLSGGKDLSKKKTVEIRYTLGFERMMKKAVANFAQMGLRPALYRSPVSILHYPVLAKSGFHGANPNKQYDFDHKDDRALFLDKMLTGRLTQVLRTAWEAYREEARDYAGPAVAETFGEPDFEPRNKPENLALTPQQRGLWLEYRNAAAALQREYILEEERSFTIIAFPVPSIGARFPEIFREIIRINTLDHRKYQDIQQTLIDTLDRAKYCEVRGRNGNRTDLRVSLAALRDPEKETLFENCVADVNIPVGEVFTSPALKGTDGVLHVGKVFLRGLEYQNLTLTFRDGRVEDYSCENFPAQEENRTFLEQNVFYDQKNLPMGEFAIGTNTTAYVAAKKYGIEGKLPILIAEKMGPHFALGDTCYAHTEEIAVFNPDGKEVVARENEVSLLRKTAPADAYFNCHTDVTIPYDELGELSAVKADGTRIPVIVDGRFVLPGCEALNEPLEEPSEA